VRALVCRKNQIEKKARTRAAAPRRQKSQKTFFFFFGALRARNGPTKIFFFSCGGKKQNEKRKTKNQCFCSSFLVFPNFKLRAVVNEKEGLFVC